MLQKILLPSGGPIICCSILEQQIMGPPPLQIPAQTCQSAVSLGTISIIAQAIIGTPGIEGMYEREKHTRGELPNNETSVPVITSRERQHRVSSDIPRPIHLEVTVPHIALPSVTEQTGTDEAAATMEQVRLLATGPSTQLVAGSWEEPATYTTRKGLFHLFQRTAELLPNTRYLLQILRPPWTSKPEELPSLPVLTDEFAFSLAYHQAGSEEPEAGIQARSTHIVIQFDEEGIPNSYRVDEVEG